MPPRDPALQALVAALAAPRAAPVVHRASYNDGGEADGRTSRTGGWLTDRLAHPWKRAALERKKKASDD